MQLTDNSTHTVLIADDDTTLNHLWRDILSDAGFDVLSCTSGTEAVDTIRRGRHVDVVLLDYNMPTLDGAQTLGQLREQFPRVKAIGVTGVACPLLPATFREGVQKLLEKPIKSSDLLNAIGSVIGIPAPTQTETVGRSINWVRFGVCYTLSLISTVGLLVLIRRAAAELLSSW
jgi:CheY-like chemotaxis protein